MTSGPHPAGAARPDGPVSAALERALQAHPAEISRLVQVLAMTVVDEVALLDLMGRVSKEAVRLIDDAHWAGVTAQLDGNPFTMAHTGAVALVVDEGQYQQGDGPCLTALRTDGRVAMTAGEVTRRWPLLAAQAEKVGVNAYLASPLHARDRSVGSLNLYSTRSGGLRVPDLDVLTVLVEYLDRGLAQYSATRPGDLEARELRSALERRHRVDTAVGIVMATESLTSDQASATLRSRAAELGRTLHEHAAAVIDAAVGRPPGAPPRDEPPVSENPLP